MEALRHTPTDEDLVSAAQRGDKQAFGQLVERYQDRVYDLSCRTLSDPARAQDAAQEAFIRAWRSMKNFKGQSKFSSWLYRIAINCCYTELRRRGLLTNALSLDDTPEAHLPPGDANPGADFERQNLVQSLIEASFPQISHYRGFTLFARPELRRDF